MIGWVTELLSASMNWMFTYLVQTWRLLRIKDNLFTTFILFLLYFKYPSVRQVEM